MYGIAKKLARELRKNQTQAEKILWSKLRDKKFMGKKFLRQHPIFFTQNDKKRFFIADFYCHKKKLVIEVDGKIHLRQKDYDEMRTGVIEQLGIKVVRFKNEEIANNLETVLKKLSNELSS